jgi:hypothetical protein
MTPDPVEYEIIARLAEAAPKARHPQLSLWRFVEDSDDLPDVDEISDDDIPDDLRETAELRRAALLVAAIDVVDRCIEDLRVIDFDENSMPDQDGAEDSFVFEWFPERHRRAYDEGFFRKVLVTAVQVAADLADPEGGPASCTGEEIVRHAIGAIAVDLCNEADLGAPWIHPDETLLEDVDFEFLYDDDMDGLEDDPGAQAARGVEIPPIQDWFAPFNDSRIVHPYAETERTAPALHNLYLRLGPVDPTAVLTPDVVDSSVPISTFAAGSEVVALSRRSADPAEGRWIADDSAPESSYAALVSAASSNEGSGWLDWEPYDGAGSIRTEPVIRLTPHRHFPVGEDEPWLEAALGSGLFVAIPIKFAVSYQPDPKIREKWENRFNIFS